MTEEEKKNDRDNSLFLLRGHEVKTVMVYNVQSHTNPMDQFCYNVKKNTFVSAQNNTLYSCECDMIRSVFVCVRACMRERERERQ